MSSQDGWMHAGKADMPSGHKMGCPTHCPQFCLPEWGWPGLVPKYFVLLSSHTADLTCVCVCVVLLLIPSKYIVIKYVCHRGPCIFYPHLTQCCRVLAPVCPQRIQGILRDPCIRYTHLVESELSVSDSPKTSSSHLGYREAEEQNGCSRKYQSIELVFLLANFLPLVKAQESPGPWFSENLPVFLPWGCSQKILILFLTWEWFLLVLHGENFSIISILCTVS